MLEDVKVPEGINKETIEHLMYPKNYGKLDEPNGVGVAMDEKTNEYVIIYIDLHDNILKDIKFATNGCQDTVVIGSMFSDMIMGNDVEYANKAVEKIVEKLGELNPQQQVCADIVFTALQAALINYNHRVQGKDEELHMLKMKESCEVVEESSDE